MASDAFSGSGVSHRTDLVKFDCIDGDQFVAERQGQSAPELVPVMGFE